MPSFSYMPRLSMASVFDILVVAFLVYEFLKLIKGTRAIPMLMAVVILAFAFWIAHVEALKTVDWLITTLLPYAIFALIVVFAAEIRHALARLGRRLSATRGGAFNGADSYEEHCARGQSLFPNPHRRADCHRARNWTPDGYREWSATGRRAVL